jgi:lipopolysaccharide/colanic/teichoic acid biosynthesis glycosyltransferase
MNTPTMTPPRSRRLSRLTAVAVPEAKTMSFPLTPSAKVQRLSQIKTVVDYPIALLMSLVALPVVLLAVLLVRLTSRGPAIYSQRRVGLGGKVFTIYKIRTMYHECESLTGPRWAMIGDPRITPLGHVLRKLHIDELPQLWNVLRGEMAMIGPRPERPEIVAELRRSVPSYDRRHVVKPGITGFAQVHLPPDTNTQSVKNKVAYDRHYIRKMGATMDLYVYFCTALKVFHLKFLYLRSPHKPTEDLA